MGQLAGAPRLPAGCAPPPPCALTCLLAGTMLQGRLTLLLGPPGSGKSVLLQTLAGQLRPSQRVRVRAGAAAAAAADGGHQVYSLAWGTSGLPCGPPDPTLLPLLLIKRWVQMSGEIRYNGRAAAEFDLQRTAAYVDQVRCLAACCSLGVCLCMLSPHRGATCALMQTHATPRLPALAMPCLMPCAPLPMRTARPSAVRCPPAAADGAGDSGLCPGRSVGEWLQERHEGRVCPAVGGRGGEGRQWRAGE